ncbi:leucine-rich repeat protein [uncultured Ruminococcus sp.]|uniref:leucine-rich repeat protein n=1 Tax=uncultured Ruminococcus sp. TaxID=165186 RepID=UPI00261880EE|nr:leucine-rich repeat protein [uncultured Ruminococcus sp.]
MNMKKIIAVAAACVITGSTDVITQNYSPINIRNAVSAAEESGYDTVTQDGIEYHVYTDHAELYKASKDLEGEIIIPEKIKGVPVTKIGDECFRECKDITSVVLPESVKTIGKFALLNCTHLNSVNIPKNITVIEAGAFQSCMSLKSVTIPDGVTAIESTTFVGCNSLTLVVIPDGVKSIGDAAFMGCTHLKSITIPETVTSIGGKALANCPQLTIYGYKGSCAEETANTYKFRFVDLAVVSSHSFGDANGDESIDAIDASNILAKYAEYSTEGGGSPTQEEYDKCDVNSDGNIDAIDASNVLAYYAYTATNGTMSLADFLRQ